VGVCAEGFPGAPSAAVAGADPIRQGSPGRSSVQYVLPASYTAAAAYCAPPIGSSFSRLRSAALITKNTTAGHAEPVGRQRGGDVLTRVAGPAGVEDIPETPFKIGELGGQPWLPIHGRGTATISF
jgi:hypothetical protein